MDAKKRNVAISALLLADLAAAEAWPAAPSIISNDIVCRGSAYRGPAPSAVSPQTLGQDAGTVPARFFHFIRETEQ